jgi:pilus assembly protein CpaC
MQHITSLSSADARRRKGGALPSFLVLGLCLAGAALAGATPARAQDAQNGGAAPPPAAPSTPPKPVVGSLGIAAGNGRIVTLPSPVASIFVANPDVVEVRPASPTSLFVFGKKLGNTTVIATDANGNTVVQYTVTVASSNYNGSLVDQQAQALAPGSSVNAQEQPGGGIIVHGTVNTPQEAENVVNAAKVIAPNGSVVNDLSVAEPIQVELKVRIAYMSRQVTNQLGIDWGSVTASGFNIGKFALSGVTGTSSPQISGVSPGALGVTFPGGTFEGVIDALASDNLAHIVAEPTLTTLSGTQANFIVGGQFPVPVAQNAATAGALSTVTVEFKNYGVQLSFTPTVFSDGRISLQVAPQLSQISTANSFTTSTGTSVSLLIPGLTVQAASSTVILGSGQGMAIAGLLEDTTNQTDNAVPGLGEVPVLGALFRGDSFSRQQQELVITVTPYLVNPVSNAGLLAQPDDGWTPPNDLQRILLLHDNGTVTAGTTIPGDAGFMVQ